MHLGTCLGTSARFVDVTMVDTDLGVILDKRHFMRLTYTLLGVVVVRE